MVDVKEIKEMKELGVTKRRSETGPWKYEYTFKALCKICGGKVEWCFCTQTLENAEKVLAAKKHTCLKCYSKPENMQDYDRERMETITKEAKDDGHPMTWDEAFDQLMELWGEGYDGGDLHELEDGTEYVDCECAI